jgi:hypothetical protein
MEIERFYSNTVNNSGIGNDPFKKSEGKGNGYWPISEIT